MLQYEFSTLLVPFSTMPWHLVFVFPSFAYSQCVCWCMYFTMFLIHFTYNVSIAMIFTLCMTYQILAENTRCGKDICWYIQTADKHGTNSQEQQPMHFTLLCLFSEVSVSFAEVDCMESYTKNVECLKWTRIWDDFCERNWHFCWILKIFSRLAWNFTVLFKG